MYKTIVERKYRRAWAALNRGDHGPILHSFAPGFEYTFVGDTPLGGTRRTIEGVDEWFQRLSRLFVSAEFHVDEVVIKGPPWRTVLAAAMTIRASVAGRPYVNEFTQFAHLRWGRVTRLRTLEDTQRMVAACQALAAAGVVEASAPPMQDTAAAN